MLTGVKASGTATLSFIFPSSHEKEIVQEVERVSEPVMRIDGVVENAGRLEIDLFSQRELEFSFDVLYDDGSIESYDGGFIDGVKKLEVPIVLSGSKRKIRWVIFYGKEMVWLFVMHRMKIYLICPLALRGNLKKIKPALS